MSTLRGDQLRGLFHSGLAAERGVFFRRVGLAALYITVAMFTLLSWYFGSYFKQEENLYRLTVRVIDLDSEFASASSSSSRAILGPAVTKTVQQYLSQPQSLGWQIEPDTSRFALSSPPISSSDPRFNRGINASEYAAQLVLDETVFAVVVINANATFAARQALLNGAPYTGASGAITLYYEEARNFDTVDLWVMGKVPTMLATATATANAQFAAEFLSNGVGVTAGSTGTLSYNLTALSLGAASGAIAQPFGWNTQDLRPFDTLAGTAGTTVGAIYLIIFTYFVSLFWAQAIGPLTPKLILSTKVLLRVFIPVAGYFWISLNYSLVSLAFHVKFNNYFGNIGFFIWWMLNWLTMTAVGLIMELMLVVLGPLNFAFFLLFWVIIQVSGVFMDLADMDHFYSYNFALPVWNQVDGSKAIAYGTKNHLPQNFLVIISWVLVGASILALVTLRNHLRLVKAMKAKNS